MEFQIIGTNGSFVSYVCVDALHPSQQFFSHGRMLSECLSRSGSKPFDTLIIILRFFEKVILKKSQHGKFHVDFFQNNFLWVKCKDLTWRMPP